MELMQDNQLHSNGYEHKTQRDIGSLEANVSFLTESSKRLESKFEETSLFLSNIDKRIGSLEKALYYSKKVIFAIIVFCGAGVTSAMQGFGNWLSHEVTNYYEHHIENKNENITKESV